MISDPTGEIRVVLWDDQVKSFKDNRFNVGRTLYIVNGYVKLGRNDELEYKKKKFKKQ